MMSRYKDGAERDSCTFMRPSCFFGVMIFAADDGIA